MGLDAHCHPPAPQHPDGPGLEFAVEVCDPTTDEIGHSGQDLVGMVEQLHALPAAREELAAIKERNRLARALHNSVKQQVFISVLPIYPARKVLSRDPGKAPARLAEAEELATEMLQALIELIHAPRGSCRERAESGAARVHN